VKALVIGASGFLGLNVVDALRDAGHEVRATRRKKTITVLLRKRGVELTDASLDDEDSLARAMSGCEVAYLTGAFYPRYSLDREGSIATGVMQVRRACRAARSAGVRRLVYTSSVATVAPRVDGRPGTEDDRFDAAPGDSVYRDVKWAMEQELDRWTASGLDAVTLLPGGCIGPWDLRAGTSALLLGVIRRELPWWVDGLVNLVDVGDVASAHVRAAGPLEHRRYCLAGHSVRVGELLRQVARRYGGGLPPDPVSPADARDRSDRDEREASRVKGRVPVPRELVDLVLTGRPISNARAERDLGMQFRPLESSLDRAHEWFVRFRYLPGGRTRETVA